MIKWIVYLLLTILLSYSCFASETGGVTIFDFSDPAALTGWKCVDDEVMGGRSQGDICWEDGKAVFSGYLSLENRGGFSSVNSPVIKAELGDYAGMKLRVLGDGRIYKLTLQGKRGTSGYFFQFDFPTQQGEWTEIECPFSEFGANYRGLNLPFIPLALSKIRTTGFLLSDGKEGPFRLEFEWIRLIHTFSPER